MKYSLLLLLIIMFKEEYIISYLSSFPSSFQICIFQHVLHVCMYISW